LNCNHFTWPGAETGIAPGLIELVRSADKKTFALFRDETIPRAAELAAADRNAHPVGDA